MRHRDVNQTTMSTDLDREAFRRALGQFVTGVAIITAAGPEDEMIGVTVSSFNSVSLDPPLILFSVDRAAHSLAALQAADGYAVNILSRRQANLSDRFATPGRNKWEAVDYTRGHGNALLLTGALARFECTPHATHEGGDHVIFVGRVVQFKASSEQQPLAYFRGRYAALDRQEGREPVWPLAIHY